MAGRIVGDFLLFGIVILILGSLSLYLSGQIYPESIPFQWLVILGIVLAIGNFDSDKSISFEEAVELAARMTVWERRVYVTTLFAIGLGIIGFQLSIIGSASAYLAHHYSLPGVAIGIAVLYPRVDAWLGRNLNLSIGYLGMITAVQVMKGVAIINNISPDVPGEARSSFHGIVG